MHLPSKVDWNERHKQCMTTTDKPGLAIGLRVLSGILISGMYVCVKEVGFFSISVRLDSSSDFPMGQA